MNKAIFFSISSIFISTIGISQAPPEIKSPADTVSKIYTIVETVAEFPGGELAWREFLSRHLQPNVPAKKGAPAGKYKVVIQFKVSKDGTLFDIQPLTSFGYGMEEEVIRVIKKSPDWVPAYQNGRLVNAYRRQPVTFEVK